MAPSQEPFIFNWLLVAPLLLIKFSVVDLVMHLRAWLSSSTTVILANEFNEKILLVAFQCVGG